MSERCWKALVSGNALLRASSPAYLVKLDAQPIMDLAHECIPSSHNALTRKRWSGSRVIIFFQ